MKPSSINYSTLAKNNLHLLTLSAVTFFVLFSSPAHAQFDLVDEGESTLKDTIVPAKVIPTWTLTANHTIGQDLQAWGEKAGWRIIWNLQKDWTIPASTIFTGEFPTVAAEVVKTLASNGALIHAQFFEGNKTMVVTGPGGVSE